MRLWIVLAASMAMVGSAAAQQWRSAALEPSDTVLAAPPGPDSPDLTLPDPTMTPGFADAPREVFCRRPTKERRHLPPGLSCRIAKAYNVPCDDIGVRYQLDHLIPLSIGGATVEGNLWPEPMADADLKDRCDRAVQALVCQDKMSLEEARRGFAEDWPSFCREHVLIKAKRK